MFTKNVKIGLTIAVVLVAVWFWRSDIMEMMRWFANREAVALSMQSIGIWGPLALFTLFVFQVFLAFIPGQALMIACGYLYGFWGGFFLSWLSLAAGGELAFILARKYGRPFAERWIAPQTLARWDKAAEGQGIVFFSISLVLPLIPNDAMCYVAGLGTIARPRFTIANLLGRGMACILTSAAGAFGGKISWQIWVVLLAIFFALGAGWLISHKNKSDLRTS